MKNLFIDPRTGIIRAGWRIAIFIGLFMVFNVVLMTGTRAILGRLPATGTVWFLVLGTAATLAAFITSKYVTKKPLHSLGLNQRIAVRDLFMGIGISALIMAGMYVLLWSLGYLEFKGFSWWADSSHTLSAFSMASLGGLAAMIIRFTIVAWWEELAFRGIFLQYISSSLSLKWGVILSTVAFALVHAGNPSATVLSTVLIMIITLQLVYAYLKSGQLWLPIGLHLGWNFFQASIFGFASSGHVSPSLISQDPVGPDWLSGGAFGAENSIFIVPLTLASFYIMHLWVKRTRSISEFGMADFLVTDKTLKGEG